MGGALEARRTAKTAASTLVLVCAGLPHPGFPQSSLDAINDDVAQRIVETIGEEQLRNGPRSAALIDPLTALGRYYQDAGDHARARAALERTLQVVRANYGLHSLDQAPLIRRLIETEEARENFATAWELELALLDLARRNSDDLRAAEIYREIGNKRMALLERYRVVDIPPPQIALGCFYDHDREVYEAARKCEAGLKSVAIKELLTDARENYVAAIDVFAQRGLYSSAQLRELEMKVVRSSYRYGNAAAGRESLLRLAAYDVANSEPWLTRITSLIQVADWDLLFSAPGPTLEQYEQAYAQLREKGVPQASIDGLFAPPVPVVLPTFLPSPFVTEASESYIDVAFRINRFGASRDVDIVDATPDVTKSAMNDTVRLIRHSRFRPRSTDGKFTDSAPIRLRYFL
jgi:hypothetical protein